ncbi:MAG: hypothetical protein MMC33_000998 [Icmadophila ericetorum]|nr:hypothetical protein [Icmadophila ericetorum]
MANRSNPNTPAKSKPLAASKLRTKRQSTQKRLQKVRAITSGTTAGRIVKRSSQAIRRAAPLSGKKARKVERQRGYERSRKGMDKEGDVIVKDADVVESKTSKGKGKAKAKAEETGAEVANMDID